MGVRLKPSLNLMVSFSVTGWSEMALLREFSLDVALIGVYEKRAGGL